MLSAIMEDRYSHNVDEIAKQLDARYSQSKAGIQAKIDELREENEKEIQSQAAISPDAQAEEATGTGEAEPTDTTEVEEVESPSVPDSPEVSAETDSNEEVEKSSDAAEATEDTDKEE